MDDGGQIVLDGVSNARALSWVFGVRAGQTGCVVRSANLDQLSAAGRLRFGELRVAVVIDLRGKAEAAAAPVLEGVTRVHLPIEPTVAADLTAERAAGTLSAASAMRVMERTYRHYIVNHTAVFAELLQCVAAAGKRPVLFHCAAGKDRTGVAAALVLTALEVPPATIMEDYLLSNRFYRPHAARAQFPEDVREAIIKIRPSYLEAAFAAMTEGWGSPGGYLKALGIGPRECAAMRKAIA